jgi:hypothetical protein
MRKYNETHVGKYIFTIYLNASSNLGAPVISILNTAPVKRGVI